MEEKENGMSNAMWGNATWGNTPPWGWNQQKNGTTGTDIAALVLGIVGTGLGLMSGGLGLFNNNRGPNGQQGGPNVMDRLAALEASVAVNTQRDIDLAEQNKLLVENASLKSQLAIKDSEAKTTALITAVNNQVITNSGILGCVTGKVNDLTQIGIPSANIITPPSGTTTTSTAGA